MPYYKQCPTCGNTNENDQVYVCNNCRHIFCRSCRDTQCAGPLGLFTIPRCPICKKIDVREVGRIGWL